MACLKCPFVAAAGQMVLPAALLDAEPALRLLCATHFADFTGARDRQRIDAIRESYRIWCECGREIFLKSTGRTLCWGCETQNPFSVVVDVKAGTDVAIKVDPSWYRTSPCDSQPCDAKLTYRLPDGRTLCVPHGAPTKGETSDVAGRS